MREVGREWGKGSVSREREEGAPGEQGRKGGGEREGGREGGK